MRARDLAVLGASLLAGTAGAQQKAPLVFEAQVETVYLDVFVTKDDKPVPRLKAADFELIDNGVAQPVEIASVGSLPLLAVLAFDASGSLAGEKLKALRVASQALTGSLKPEDEVALFTFAEEIDWWVRPTRDKTRVTGALERLTVGGGTAVVDAVYAAVTLPVTKARSLVVLFTDGEDNMSWLSWREVQVIAERSNALIHVVSMRKTGPAASVKSDHPWAMCQIAEATGGRCWEAASTARLREAFAAIADAMSNRYVLRYEPQNVKRPGWHAVEVRLRGQKADVHARRGYWVADR